jgi:hypothetical protein
MSNQKAMAQAPASDPALAKLRLADSKGRSLTETRAGAKVSQLASAGTEPPACVTDSLVRLISLATRWWV